MRSRAAKAFSEFYEAMRKDIYVFCRAMNYEPSPQHRQLLDAVQAALKKTGPSKIAVKSGQGPGKTKCSGIVGLYLLLHNPYTKLLLTAPTMRQCKDAWLGEVKQSLNAADPMMRRLFTLTGTGIGVLGRKPSEWGALLLTATRSENLQGQHRKDMHLIVEEASGVPRELIEQFKGTLSNPNALFIQIGNPNCLMAGMDIYSPSHGRVAVEDFVSGAVVSMESDHSISTQTAKRVPTGSKRCVRVTLNSGQVLELSHDHPLYTEKGWVWAEKCIDLLVATPSFLPAPLKPKELPTDIVKFAAYMIADGCTTASKGKSSRCSFTQMPGPVLDELLSLPQAARARVYSSDKSKAMQVELPGNQDLLRSLGISCQISHTKRVPSEFFLLPNDQIALFLNRLWSCDGTFNRYGPKICLCNRKLLEDIRTLLLRLGIHSRVHYTKVRNRKTFDYLNGRDFDAWTLSITEKSSVLKWNDTVGEVLGKEGKCPMPKGGNPNSDVVPITVTELDEMLDEMGLPDRATIRHKYRRVRRMSHASFVSFCKETGYSGKHARYLPRDIRWEKVKSIEHIGTQRVYDITVPATGNFVCENVIVHNTRESQFFDCFNSQSHKWKTLTWSAEDTPASEWFDPQRNLDLEEEFGRDSDVYRVRVLGEFPDTDPNCVMSSDDLEICGDRKLLIPCTRLSTAKTMGLDFARFGGDESTIYRRSGEAIVESFVRGNIDPNDLCDKAFDMQRKAHWKDSDCWYIADAGGMGQGVMANFHRAGKRVTEFHNGGSPTDRQYANKITQAYFEMAKKVRRHEMYLPKDHVLIQQLSSRQYHTNAKGKLILESKDVYMKRHELSPDRADGIVLAMWDHRQANATISRRMEESSRRVGSI